MVPKSGVLRRRRPPFLWNCAVSARKRWHRLRRLWRLEQEVEEVFYFDARFSDFPA